MQKKFSNTANKCPNCGHKRKNKTNSKFIIKGIVFICICLLSASLLVIFKNTDNYKSIPLVVITSDFNNNIVDCKNKYDNKKIEFGSAIDEIGIDQDDNNYIIFFKSNYYDYYVKCVIKNKKESQKLSKYHVGDVINVQGTCHIKSNYILFTNCKIISK